MVTGAAVPIRGQAWGPAGRVPLRRGRALRPLGQAGEHPHPLVPAAHRQPAQQLGRSIWSDDISISIIYIICKAEAVVCFCLFVLVNLGNYSSDL